MFGKPLRRVCAAGLALVMAIALAACEASTAAEQPTSLGTVVSVLATENGRLSTEVHQLQEWNAYQSTQIGAQQLALNALTTEIPGGSAADQPPTFTPTPYDLTPDVPTPYDRPTGVMIEDGNCCVGGTAGETITVAVQFLPEQTDLAQPAVEMRVITGAVNVTLADMASQPWQPFVEEAVYPVYLAINWTTFWVHVQYRAADGTVSALYSDEIGVEGMPPATSSP